MSIELSAITVDALGIRHELSVSTESNTTNPKDLLDSFYDQCARLMQVDEPRWNININDPDEPTEDIRRP